jgi:hypothetical protein
MVMQTVALQGDPLCVKRNPSLGKDPGVLRTGVT